MRIINVIEMVDGDFLGSIESFPIWEEQLSEDVVKKKKKLFADRAKENGADENDIESYIEDGYYDNGTEGNGGHYEVFITWSNVNE